MFRYTLLLITLYLVGSAYSAANCKFGSTDFSGFVNASSYSFTAAGGINYVWNVCAVSNKCVTNLNGKAGTTSCQQATSGWQLTGLLNSGTWTAYDNGAGQVNYKADTPACGSGNVRQTFIRFQCAKGQVNKAIQADETSQKCIYEIIMSGDAACGSGTTSGPSGSGSGSGSTTGGEPSKGGIGGGWIFVIILLVCTVVYIAAGMVINAKVRHLHGKEMFPNYHFWSEFPGLLKDGVLFIKSKVSGGGSSAGYQQV